MAVIEKARMGMIAVAAVMLVSVMRRLMGARRLSSGMIALVVAGVVLLVAAGSASATDCGAGTGRDCQCGDTVVGDWTFTGDMVCTDGTKPGLIVGANNIVIDGAGFSMTGNRSDCTCTNGILGGNSGEQNPAKHSGIVNNGDFDNVVIKNLEIKNFCTGIAFGDMIHTSVDNNTVIDCKIHDCGKSGMTITHGIHTVGINNCSIIKNKIYNIDGGGVEGGCSGGGNGVFMYGVSTVRGNHNNITYNNLSYNKKSGFFMKMKCMHNIISSNIATGNDEGGIVLMCMKSNYNTIESNNTSENVWYGIFIGGRNNTIRYNTVINNGYYGIDMGRSDGSYNNELCGNTVCGNEDTDIRTCGPECYGNHGDNNTCNTTSYYNDDGTAGCTYSCGSSAGICGDVNGDNKVNIGDVIRLANHVGFPADTRYTPNCG